MIDFDNGYTIKENNLTTTLALGLPGREVRADVARTFDVDKTLSNTAQIDNRRYRLIDVTENNNTHLSLVFTRFADLGAERDDLIYNLETFVRSLFTTNNLFTYSPHGSPSTGHQFQDYLEFLYWIRSTQNQPAAFVRIQTGFVRGSLLTDLIRAQYRDNADLPQLVNTLQNFAIAVDFNGTVPKLLPLNLPEESDVILPSNKTTDYKVTYGFNNSTPTKGKDRELSIQFRAPGSTAIQTLVRPKGQATTGSDIRAATTQLPTLHGDRIQDGGVFEALLEEAIQRERLINYGRSLVITMAGDYSSIKLGSLIKAEVRDGWWRVERNIINKSAGKLTSTITAFAHAPRPEFTPPYGVIPNLTI